MAPLFKLVSTLIARMLLKAGYIFPVKRTRVLFSSYEGRQYTCNPKYIFEGMINQFGDRYEYIWVLNNKNQLPEKYRSRVNTVSFLSCRHIYYMLTSGIIISNLGIEPIFPKRRCQKFINTWHGGGAYKRVSVDMNMFGAVEKFYMRKVRKIRSRDTDYFISSCRRFTEVSSRAFEIKPEVFVSSGMPRNDYLFNRDEAQISEIRDMLCRDFDIQKENLLVLYAPTFRDSHRHQRYIENKVCCQKVKHALESRFGKNVTFLLRSHLSPDNSKIDAGEIDVPVVDVTQVSDMQCLLSIADVLITDYSSSIWDFCITEKPGFIFCPDLHEYAYNRGFYTPMEKWPYEYAETTDDLCRVIASYDGNVNKKRIIAHMKELGTYENGDAVAQILQLISR